MARDTSKNLNFLNPRLSDEEKRRRLSEAGKKGAKAAAESKRRRKTFEQSMKWLLSMSLLPEDLAESSPEIYDLFMKIKGGDIESEDGFGMATLTLNDLISMAQINNALNGDNRSFENVRDTIGEKPVDKVRSDIYAEGLNITIDDGE